MGSGFGMWVLTRHLFLGNPPLWRGSQGFTSQGTLQYKVVGKECGRGPQKQNKEMTHFDPVSAFS
jgi:hypothetical protein